MKIFISWSGAKSGAVAAALRDWLPGVIQVIEPWISAKDIDKGARWRASLANELENSDFGIVCLTRDNLESPWLLFEAGALSKFQTKSRVCTFLLGLEAHEVRDPLGQFQHTKAERADVFKLIQTLNDTLENDALKPNQLEKAFRLTWPELKRNLNKIMSKEIAQRPTPSLESMVEEILGYTRNFSGISNNTPSSKNLTSEELVLLGRILSTNNNLNVVNTNESQIEFHDGTHGTSYKINRRFLASFLQRLRRESRKTRKE